MATKASLRFHHHTNNCHKDVQGTHCQHMATNNNKNASLNWWNEHFRDPSSRGDSKLEKYYIQRGTMRSLLIKCDCSQNGGEHGRDGVALCCIHIKQFRWTMECEILPNFIIIDAKRLSELPFYASKWNQRDIEYIEFVLSLRMRWDEKSSAIIFRNSSLASKHLGWFST